MALASILGPFLVYLLKFTLLTPFLHTFFFSLLLLGSHPGSLMHYLGVTGISGWNLLISEDFIFEVSYIVMCKASQIKTGNSSKPKSRRERRKTCAEMG